MADPIPYSRLSRIGINPAARPTASPTATRSRFQIPVTEMDLRALGVAAESIQELTQFQDVETAKQEFGKHRTEYLADRKKFAQRVYNGEIPEYANPMGREWFFGLDAQLNLNDFKAQFRDHAQKLATAEGPDGKLLPKPALYDEFNKAWDGYEKSASFNTDAGRAIIANELPGVFAEVNEQFIVQRQANENAMRRKEISTNGASILGSLAVAPNAVEKGVFAQKWRDFYNEVHDVGTLEMQKLQLDAAMDAIGSTTDKEKALKLVDDIRRLPYGRTTTFGEDPDANAKLNREHDQLERDVITGLNIEENKRNAKEVAARHEFDKTLYLEIQDDMQKGVSDADLYKKAKATLDGLKLPEDIKADLFEHARQKISAFRSDRGAALSEEQRQNKATAMAAVDAGQELWGWIEDQPASAFPDGVKRALLIHQENARQGRAALDGSTFNDDVKALRDPIVEAFHGETDDDQFARSQLDAQTLGLQRDFYKAATDFGKPTTEDGKQRSRTPAEIGDWLRVNKDAYKAQVDKRVAYFRERVTQERKVIEDSVDYRSALTDRDLKAAAQYLSPKYLEKKKALADALADPFNDFGDPLTQIPSAKTLFDVNTGELGSQIARLKFKPLAPPGADKATTVQLEKAERLFRAKYQAAALELRKDRTQPASGLPGRLNVAYQQALLEAATEATAKATGASAAKAASATVKPAAEKLVAAATNAPASKPAAGGEAKAESAPAAAPGDYVTKSFEESAQAFFGLPGLQKEALNNVLAAEGDKLPDVARSAISSFRGFLGLKTFGFLDPRTRDDMTLAAASSAIDILDRKDLSEEQKIDAAASVMSLTGQLTPQDVLAGKATVEVPKGHPWWRQSGEPFRKLAREVGSSGELGTQRYRSAADRVMETLTAPRTLLLNVQLNPALTPLRWRDNLELDEWIADGRLDALMATPQFVIPPAFREQFIGIQRAWMAKTRIPTDRVRVETPR